MIEHVRRRALLAPVCREVIVATCDEEICQVVRGFGGQAVMTSSRHERGTDRVEEAVRDSDADIVINLQGDEPCVLPQMLEDVARPLLDEESLLTANLMAPIASSEEYLSPDVVKAAVDLKSRALYFSREPIPSAKKISGHSVNSFKQLGIIAFRADFLRKFAGLEPTPLEIVESVDMMRVLEHGYEIRMVLTRGALVAVDQPGDITRAEEILRTDPLVERYWPASKV